MARQKDNSVMLCVTLLPDLNPLLIQLFNVYPPPAGDKQHDCRSTPHFSPLTSPVWRLPSDAKLILSTFAATLALPMKPVDVTTQIIINRPREAVASFAADPDNTTKWYTNIKSVECRTPKPMAIGTLLGFRAKFLGKDLCYVYKITEHIPGRKLVMKTKDGPFPMETTYTWEDAEPGTTKMTLRNTGNPSGFSRLFSPLMSMAIKSANNKDLRLLKKILEK